MENKQTEGIKIGTPGAIILAGIIVALAVVFTRGTATTKIVDDTNTAPQPVAQNITTPISRTLGLNRATFATCLMSGKYTAKVEAQYQDGLAVGVQGTPSSVVVTKSGVMQLIVGGLPYDQFKAELAKIPAKPAKDQKAITMAPVTSADHIYGNPDAPTKIVEYSDTECPFCKQFHPTIKRIIDESNGTIALVYRHFPLDSIHPKTRHEAEATECAADQGGNDMFWKYTDALFTATNSNNTFDPNLL